MSLRNLPVAQAFERPEGLHWDPPSDALERWSATASAAADEPGTISIMDVIGVDWWTGEGVTAKRISGALRAIGAKPVTVSVNSPGGDMFEGLAIYNLLREHPAEVTVKVMGLAASAASIIAMAGDRIEVGLGSFLMIHNAWGSVVGNRHDWRAAADTFEQYDAAMADIYAARTGQTVKAVAQLMDAETFMRASEAVDKGFADATFNDPAPSSDGATARAELSARRRLDALLAKDGLPRSERRRLMREALGTSSAAEPPATLRAGFDPAAALRLLETIRS
ncbi:head maturation protease, ClpP-related [Azospirillum agricola]|uniref:head maturation protease, ClpP-related n=1 Tax=Azospirillum agricola TaxID=1720247 RepID=UPI000A0F3B2B|nr:head maturation protease, ClpP-related [Azospirillum agricola]SMH29607.1 ATP-dependent protease ClpP, protease subunit [Azospirillum lipoferum]SMH30579.1 ATP-dependent protease ClpP, protease subunit [Azospirillum lipoferum]